MVKPRQLAPIVGQVSDDLPTNLMTSPNRNDALEKGTTFTFGSWTCIADGSGCFTNHLDDHQVVESVPTNQHLLNNSTALEAGVENPPEDPQEEKNFDQIKRYWADPESTVQTRVDNSDLLDGIDRMTNKLAECVNLAQSSLDKHGVPRISDPTITKPKNHHSSDISPM